ncbi:MAG TPA: translocation/assembly module TamB domain-containing protein [Gemmatimonadaceae bacterium]|nr:translocation/assembly module TamB domain-containing protein [Gemmatimonadaceae bacterium]
MSRRRLVAIISAAALLLIGVVAAAAVLSVTQTDLGRDYVRRYLQAQVASKLGKRGTMYIGRISGGLVTGVVVDSFAIRDDEDSLFVSAGPIEITYDPRDIIDKRLLIGQLVIHKPFVNLRRHSDGVWNYRRIFPKGAPRVRTPDRRFGDYIVIDSATIHDGTVIVTMPWSPSDTLTARQRDSALAYARTTGGHEIRETKEGLKKTWRWTGLEVEAPFARIADPDSAGRLIVVGDMDVDETDPPFKFRNVQGPVRIGDDTVRFDITHFDLPGSTGRARGMVHWKTPGPVRYDVQVAGDSVSLADIAWVYPTLPRQGSGRMLLHIVNDARDPRVIDYRITRMDVRAARSHLVGDWTFGVGGPVLVVKDVDLRAEPVDFDLFRTLAGGPFPVDWQGTLTGSVRGRGGRLDRFMVDEANITFRDKHVPGAVTRASASGGLNILDPAFTKFLGLSLDIETLDLRTPQFLFADFPRLRGTISGTAVLDSSWMDVRFREADVTLRDGGPGESHFTGSGRVTYGEELLSFDVDLFAQPIDFTQFARSYPALPARGPHTGPLRVQGTMADLVLAATMRGDAGMMSVDGRFDMTAPGFAAEMTGAVEDLDPRALLARDDILVSRLTGQYRASLSGDSLANLDGTLAIDLDRSTVGGVRIFPSTASLTFAGGLVRVDTMRIETTAATLTASGALSLAEPRADSMRYTIVVDSLGGLRPWIPTDRAGRGARALAREDTATGARRDSLVIAYRDSLAGSIQVSGWLRGSIDSLATTGSVEGRGLFVAGDRARAVRGSYALAGLPRTPAGLLTLALDTLVVEGVRLDSARIALDATGPTAGRLALGISSATGPRGRLSLAYAFNGDTTSLLVDTLGAVIGDRQWTLASPARVTLDSTSAAVDSLALVADGGARVVLAGDFPSTRPVDASFRMYQVPLADLGAIVQSRSPLGGLLTLELGITGMRDDPTMRLSATADTVRVDEIHFPRLDARATYARRRLDGEVRLVRDNQPAINLLASLPLDLALTSVEKRLIEDSLRVSLRADSMNLALLETMVPRVSNATGRLQARLDVAGTWTRPSFTGTVLVNGGQMALASTGTLLRNINGSLTLTGDTVPTIRLDSLVMASGEARDSRASLSGTVRFSQSADSACAVSSLLECLARRSAFDVSFSANNFEAIRQRRIADLEISGGLRLAGDYESSLLTGGLRVERGAVYLRERLRKQIVNVDRLEEDEFGAFIDTTSFSAIAPVARGPGWAEELQSHMAISNVDIAIGDDVWLRSQEASIKLAGSVSVTRTGDQITLEGPLLANRGTYRLYLAPGVIRTFEVQRGVITFFGGPAIDPALDIVAVHTVRQAGSDRRDVRIRVTIGGTLSQPRLALSSDERIQISETQILSYLVSGQPTFVAENTGQLQTAFATLVPTLGALVERAIFDQLRFLDMFQLQTTQNRQFYQVDNDPLNLVWQSRIAFGKQLTERTFLSANAGLCSIGGQDSQNHRFLDAFGLTLEHRLNHGFSLQMSVEPATSAALCRTDAVEFNRPRQFGLDLFREWSF